MEKNVTCLYQPKIENGLFDRQVISGRCRETKKEFMQMTTLTQMAEILIGHPKLS